MVHAVLLGMILGSAAFSHQVVQQVKPREVVTLIAPSPDSYTLPASKTEVSGGGGGGDQDPLPAPKGRLPQIAMRQITPPQIVLRNEKPKLPVEATVVVPPQVILLSYTAWSADNGQSDIDKRIAASATVVNEIMATPDKAIPDKVMSDAKCVAVIPSMVKVALVFGGNHGKGIATCRTEEGGWSAVAPITITGGSWGLQLGGQAVDLVMIVTNDEGMQHLLHSKFKLGADASAAAGPVGRDAAADTDWKMKAEVLTYSRARGVFAGIDLNGSAVT
ncbi:MAG: lipid-binding SYLF domain-containing protein, partial [Candidatus Sulfotelmatobacter sp.]